MRIGQQEREAAKETTAATQADLGRLEQSVTKLKAIVANVTGWRTY